MTTPGYGLMKRDPAMTREEFSQYWEKKHAPLVIPWALQYGIEYYAQASLIPRIYVTYVSPEPTDISSLKIQLHKMLLTISQMHNIRLAPNAPPLQDLAIEEWDGAVQMKMPSPEIMAEAFKDPYYLNVILPDERRFLVSEAKLHIKIVPPEAIAGERKVIIEGGKVVIGDQEVEEALSEAEKAWRGYQGGERGVV
jgi:hypothetical protein